MLLVIRDLVSTARVRGARVLRIPGGVMKLVSSTCAEQLSGHSVLFEPLQSDLPAGIIVSPCLVQVERGTVHILVINVGTTEVVLHPRVRLGQLSSIQVVSLPMGVTEERSTMATVSSQVITSSGKEG